MKLKPQGLIIADALAGEKQKAPFSTENKCLS